MTDADKQNFWAALSLPAEDIGECETFWRRMY